MTLRDGGQVERLAVLHPSQTGAIVNVSTQIAVGLPDSLVAWINELVAAGGGSRAAVTTEALRRYQRQVAAERDAQIYRATGGYPDLEGMHEGQTQLEVD